MPCGAAQCRCSSFQPQKWAPTKCHSCFHWDHQHEANAIKPKAVYPPPQKEHVTPPPADLPSKPGSVALNYKYPGLSNTTSPRTAGNSFSAKSPANVSKKETLIASSKEIPKDATTSKNNSPAKELPKMEIVSVSDNPKSTSTTTPPRNKNVPATAATTSTLTSNDSAAINVSDNNNLGSDDSEASGNTTTFATTKKAPPPLPLIKSTSTTPSTQASTMEPNSYGEDAIPQEEATTDEQPTSSASTTYEVEQNLDADSSSQPSQTELPLPLSPTPTPPPVPAFSGSFAPPAVSKEPPPKPQRPPRTVQPSSPIVSSQPLPVDSEAFNLDKSRPRFKENNTPTTNDSSVGRIRRDNLNTGPEGTEPSKSPPLAHRRVASADLYHHYHPNEGSNVSYHQSATHTHHHHQRIASSDSSNGHSHHLDDSDDDDHTIKNRETRQETMASLSSKVSVPFRVIKGNKYGVKQHRVIAIDDNAMTLKFCDPSLRLRSEVPVSHLTLTVSEDNDRKIALSFKQRSRVYDIVFETAAECTAFVANLDTVVKAHQDVQRKEDAALLNAFMGGDSSQEVSTENKHQEFRVVQKHKLRPNQQRILVLKPTTLVLLDGAHKFIQSFPYEQIYSVETNAAAEEKRAGAYEAETFLVFNQSASQRSLQVFFADHFDRQLFSQTLQSLHRRLIIMDGDHPSSARFIVTKSNTAAPNKGTQRILEILASDSILRSSDRAKHFKDTAFSAVRCIEACSSDNKRVFFEVQRKRLLKRFAFDFSDTLTRARFLAMATFALDSQRTIPPGLKISIFVGTWNVGGSSPSVEFFFLDQFIKSDSHDIYAISMQECPQGKRDDWVVEFQRHCGGHSREFAALGPAERKAQAKYEIVASSKLWEISILILVRKELVYKVTAVSEITVACGVGDLLGNKGAAAVFMRYEDTSLGFVGCHLAARAERLKERRQDFLKIVKGIRVGEGDVINTCDHLFWFGDLNYRVEKGFHETIAAAEAKQFDDLAACDQLRREMTKGPKDLVFPGFQEGRLAFAPTYRWEKTRNVFSNKREQPPSYTDRVLWHSLQQQALNLETYDSAPDIMGSDHRPCYAAFTLMPRSYLWGGKADTSLEIVIKSINLSAEEPELACLRLVVSAPFLRESEVCPQAVREVGALKWQWTEVHLRAYVGKDHLPQQHLLVCAQAAQTQEVVGYATVPLAMHESRFRSQLTKDGLLLGFLSGNLSVYPTPEDINDRVPRRHAVVEGTEID